jgi:putative transposase
MVEHPAEYPWSSYRANAQGESSKPLTPHSLYASLAPNEAIRQASYRKLFRHQLDPKLIDEIRTATNGNYTLGSSLLLKQVSAILKQRVTPGRSGRPRTAEEVHSLELITDG